jgi:hypothetical protein
MYTVARFELFWDRCYVFLNIFAEKFSENFGVFDWKQSYFLKKYDDNIGFWENANFFAKNCQKSQKIVIITSTPVPLADTMTATHTSPPGHWEVCIGKVLIIYLHGNVVIFIA